jgi:hypothetical protein
VQDRLNHSFSAEAVERPEEHEIELAAVRVLEQPGELCAALCALTAGFVIDILGRNLMPRPGAPFPQRDQLVLGVLAFVVSAYPRVNSDPHRYSPKIRARSL